MKYRKKPVVIEAVCWTGENLVEVLDFTRQVPPTPITAERGLLIETLEGTMQARPGDWIIRGVKGEFYPCKDEIFRMTYEPA